MKLKRRQVLLGGMVAGITATAGTEYHIRKQKRDREASLQALAEQQLPKDTDSLLKATFEADAQKINQGKEIQASVKLAPPQIPYSREISKLLIQCSKIATQQYLTGKAKPSYDGNIKSLPAYTRTLDGYTQIASFRGQEAQSKEVVQVEVPTNAQTNSQDQLEQSVDEAEKAITKTITENVSLKRLIPVYYGFVLTSKNIT